MCLDYKERLKYMPFVWTMFESKSPNFVYKYIYDDNIDLNIIEINGKHVPLIIYDDIFRKTHTVTEVKNEKIDEDPS
jgi:hypothetical protein